MQNRREARVHLGVVGIQQPSLVEAPHGHAELVGLIKTIALRDPGLRGVLGRAECPGGVGNEFLVAGLPFRGRRPIHAAIHRQFIDARLDRRGRRRLAGARGQQQRGGQEYGLQGNMHVLGGGEHTRNISDNLAVSWPASPWRRCPGQCLPCHQRTVPIGIRLLVAAKNHATQR
ncbi:hypothetical protein D3C71_1660190 [compost metagenome]